MTGRAIAYGRPNASFTMITNDFLRDPAIRPSAFRVACFVMSHDDTFVMTQASIGKALGMNRGTVSDAFSQLEDLGYLVRQPTHDERGFRTADDLLLSQVPFTAEQVEDLCRKNQHGKNQHGFFQQHKEDQSNKKNKKEEEEKDMSGQPDDDAEPEPAAQEKRKDGLTLPVLDAQFDAWYEQYPRKEGKGQARLKYRQARRAGVTVETLDAGVTEYVARLRRDGTPKTYTKLPGTWLNGECWLDEDVVRRDVAPVRAAPVRSGDPGKFAGIPVGTLLNP